MGQGTGRRVVLVATVALLVAGCGSSGTPLPKTLSVATKHGLSYTLAITGGGKTACTDSTYRTALPTGQPILQGAHLCGPSIVFGHPLLVQAHTSTESIIVDLPSSGCGTVKAITRAGAFTPLVSHCTQTTPIFRVTILPQARRLRLQGIPAAPVINFPRHVCKKGLCITALAS